LTRRGCGGASGYWKVPYVSISYVTRRYAFNKAHWILFVSIHISLYKKFISIEKIREISV
jgi:hypothetical protein